MVLVYNVVICKSVTRNQPSISLMTQGALSTAAELMDVSCDTDTIDFTTTPFHTEPRNKFYVLCMFWWPH